MANTSTEGFIMLEGDAVPMVISGSRLTMEEGSAKMVFVKS